MTLPARWGEWEQALLSQLPALKEDSDFIWTDSRKKIAFSVQIALNIRQFKITKQIAPTAGINGALIEGEPGLGKSRLLLSVLKAHQIPYDLITTSKPELMRQQLLEAFHEGKVAIIDELNSFPDEQLLNALLSGTDLAGNPARNPGFYLLATQNPITYAHRQALSPALANRLVKLNLNHYAPAELQSILQRKFKINPELATHITSQFNQAREYAETQKFFPKPNTRSVFNEAKQIQERSCQNKMVPG
jgi:MoxR-like ATPase